MAILIDPDLGWFLCAGGAFPGGVGGLETPTNAGGVGGRSPPTQPAREGVFSPCVLFIYVCFLFFFVGGEGGPRSSNFSVCFYVMS